MSYDLRGKRIWIAGHRGMVGSALTRRLASEACEIVTISREQLDLTRQRDVETWLHDARPDTIVLAAAFVGGILANQHLPAAFLHDNLMIAANVVHAAHQADIDRLLFLGSSCIYPRLAPQPIGEDALLSGPLEPSNEPYAIAKIAGLKLVDAFRRQYGRDYISAMPTNLYGPGDNFDPFSSHVLPALIRKAHEAKRRRDRTMTIWGSGAPRREFLHVDDCADALVLLLKAWSAPGHVNVGSGWDLTILELARLVCDVVGFEGQIAHDLSRPDGTPQKLMNSDRLGALGWSPAIPLADGIAATYRWFLDHVLEPA
ncbi:MAG: GDP-fucose synthetase [Pelagibacterium sp. SCN 63-23]|mgnify:CR=1 FL=1|nr:MAG: GDP-fucose synthetase [Pelagibacterium sp. SCN 63-23]